MKDNEYKSCSIYTALNISHFTHLSDYCRRLSKMRRFKNSKPQIRVVT